MRLLPPVVVLGLLICSISWTNAADDQPAPDARIRGALSATEWIYDLDSARIDVSIRTTRPPESVEANRAQYLKELESLGVDTSGGIPEEVERHQATLQPATEARLELAWDRSRFASRSNGLEPSTDVAIWDGVRGLSQLRRFNQNDFGIHRAPPNWVNHFFSWLPLSLTADHYAPLQVDVEAVRQLAAQRARTRQDEADLIRHSTVTFAGAECDLFTRRLLGSWERYYVDRATGRLRGAQIGSWGLVWRTVSLPIVQEALAARGIAITTDEQAQAAVAQLPAQEQRAFQTEMLPKLAAAYWDHVAELDPLWTVRLEDWLDVQPGRAFPFRQIFEMHRVAGHQLVENETRVVTIDRFDANQPLDDALFALTIDEGARVYDETHDPPLRYTQDSRRTPEEWSALIAKARESQAEDQAELAALEALVGTGAPEFPDTTWLNARPLTWKQLAGRYVLLDFWHIGCGPCWGYIPWLQAIHDDGDADAGIAVIGVHGAGIEPDAIGDELSARIKADVTFPICVDLPLAGESDSETYPSQIFHHYGIRRMPYAWLVGPDGKLIAHGDLPTLYEKARVLMQQAENK